MALDTTEAKAGLLRDQLAESDGRVSCRVAVPSSPWFLSVFTSPSIFFPSLFSSGSRAGEVASSSGIGHGIRRSSQLFLGGTFGQYPVPCPGYCRLHVHRGTSVALLVGELRFGRSLLDVIGPPSSLLDDRLEDILEGYDEAPSRVMDKLSIDNVVRKAW